MYKINSHTSMPAPWPSLYISTARAGSDVVMSTNTPPRGMVATTSSNTARTSAGKPTIEKTISLWAASSRTEDAAVAPYQHHALNCPKTTVQANHCHERLGLGGRAVVDNNFMPRRQQVPAHGLAHDAETNPAKANRSSSRSLVSE